MSLGVPTRQDALWTVALNCALARENKKCRNKWDSSVCSSCKLYIKNYIDASPAQAQLYMLQAETSAGLMTVGSHGYRYVCLTIALVLGLGLFGSYTTLSKRDYTSDSVVSKVKETNKYIANNIIDINGDGEKDCEDYAIMFYKYYPLGKVKILINSSEVGNFHHAFNSVYVDNMWKPIEPQAIGKNPIWMDQYWEPKKYNPKLNEDYTNFYKQFSGKVSRVKGEWVLWFYGILIVVGFWIFLELVNYLGSLGGR